MIKRSNFVVGLGASVVLHGLLVAVLLRIPSSPRQPTPPPIPIQIASVDPDQKIPLDPLPADPAPAPLPAAEPALVKPPPAPDPAPPPVPELAPPPVPEPAPPPVPDPAPVVPPLTPAPPPDRLARRTAQPDLALELVHTPVPREPQVPDPASDGRMPPDGDSEYVPPLRVHWRDASELVSVARTLGMRLAAVDAHGAILGEIDLSSRPSLKRWQGLPSGYSNRVRMLSPSIFSTNLGNGDVREIWVFVPADRDRVMVQAQKSAVLKTGARLADVQYVDGRFVRAANGSYRLDITNIRQVATRRRVDG